MADAAATILLYHGVTDAPSEGVENFSDKHVRADVFDRQMAWLSANATPMRLEDLAHALQSGAALPERAVAVTFDDTFKNNRTVALPILQRHGVPATFFVTTGFVNTERRFWVDRVEHAINYCPASELALNLNGESKTFSLGTDGDRIAAIIAVKGAMKAMAPDARDATLTHLEDVTRAAEDTRTVANYANMDWNDVRALDAGPNYDVGGHTVNHEILAYLDEDKLDFEVNTCLKDLKRELGHDVTLFSYPEGQANHYDDRVIATLKTAGITVCPSAINGVCRPGDDPFHLKRIMVGFMGEPFPFDATLN